MTQACFSNISCVTNETFVTESAFCKKCHSKDLSKDVDGFPVCIQCGWANYDLPIPKAPTPSFIHLRASSFYVPYIGHTWKLKGLKLQVWVRDGNMYTNEYGTLKYEAECAFCEVEYRGELDTRIKIRKSDKFLRYLRCNRGHKIRFIETKKEEIIGWQ